MEAKALAPAGQAWEEMKLQGFVVWKMGVWRMGVRAVALGNREMQGGG